MENIKKNNWENNDNNLNKYAGLTSDENNIIEEKKSHEFLFLSSHRKDYFNKMSSKLDPTNKKFKGYVLEELFFSDSNMEIVQRQIVLNVYKLSNKEFLIPFQNDKSILIVMKYIFAHYAQNLPYNITEQIRDLNNKIVNNLTPMIIKNIKHKEQYLKDASNPLKTMDRPISVSSAGNKTLPSITNTF